MENANIIQHAESDVISLIFSYIIFEADDFSSFTKLLIIWERRQPRSHVKDVLERLNWDSLYEYHQHPMEVTRDEFYGFIAYSVRNNVHQAMFFDSSHHLLRHINVQHHLAVLSMQSNMHFPSYFASLCFKAIYTPVERNLIAQEMLHVVKNLLLRPRVGELLSLLADMSTNIVEEVFILPVSKFCLNARNTDPFNLLDGPPLHRDIWDSLCCNTVEENPNQEGEILGQTLGMQHLWKGQCAQCTLQLIVSKILLNIPLY